MRKISTVLSLALAVSSQQAMAAGFELLEQSVNGVGQATAGVSTGFGDGSEVYFNPAAMAHLEKNTASAGLHFVIPSAKFNNEGSAYLPQLGGTPLSGDNGGDAGGVNLVPNAYITYRMNDAATFGLAVNSPFGLKTEYEDGWVGRYAAIKSELMTVNINPAISYKVNDMLALGAGLQVMYADATLSNAIDLGTIGAGLLGLPTAMQLGMIPQHTDGMGEIKGSDWGLGVGVGGVITPEKGIRFGVSWRSRVRFNLTGDADFTVPTGALALTQTGLFTDTTDSADIELPESVAFGTAVDLCPNWAVYADATWTRWSRLQNLTVQYDSVQPDTVLDMGWNNSWRYALGTRYGLDDKWTLRGGVAWDMSPVADAAHRTPRVPDQDRFWLAAGIGYDLTENTSLSLSYAHLFVGDADSTYPTAPGSVLTGGWDLGVNIASLSLTTTF